MHNSDIPAFKDELTAILDELSLQRLKTLRNIDLIERIRTVFIVWNASILPELKNMNTSQKEIGKVNDELQKLALLTTKIKPIFEFTKRIKRAIQGLNHLVIVLPPSGVLDAGLSSPFANNLFVQAIPDLPIAFVPRPIFGWKKRIEEFLTAHPYDKSVFIMIRYRPRTVKIIGEIKKKLKKANLEGIVASDHSITDDLYNPIACLLCCSKGIAVFDRTETNQTYNPNVAYELGMMHLLGRNCLIFKHTSLKSLQTDILMKLYTSYYTCKSLGMKISELYPPD